MSEVMTEIIDELYNCIDNLRDLFDDFDFNTQSGYSSSDLDGIEGFESIAVKDEQVLSFNKFKKAIKFDFFSNDDDIKISDFDWDALESRYETLVRSYTNYKDLCEEIEDNLTGELSLESIEVMDKEDLMERLLNYMIEENLIYEVTHNEKGVFYIPNAEIADKIKE